MHTIRQFGVAATFGVAVNPNLTVPGFDAPGPMTPRATPGYVFRLELLRPVILWLLARLVHGRRATLALTGPSGSGKTSLITEVAARLNVPLWTADAHHRLEVPDLLVTRGVLDGTTYATDGPLLQPYRSGGMFLLNEYDLLEPGCMAGLNGVADFAPLSLPENGGEVVPPHPQFLFAVTGNTAGGGDANGLYGGTFRTNESFRNRWSITVPVGYPTKAEDEQYLGAAFPALPEDIRRRIAAFAVDARAVHMAPAGRSLEVPVSTRTLADWAFYSQVLKDMGSRENPVREALRLTLDHKTDAQGAVVVEELYQAHFGDLDRRTRGAAP